VYHLYAERFIAPSERKFESYRKCMHCFEQGFKRRYPTIERVEVPYEGKNLPAFFMKAPGAGMLEFVVKPGDGGRGSTVNATAYWHPAGVLGLLYWYALVPTHLFLFKGMTRAIERRASALERSRSYSSAPRGLK